ncbi:hypothetical protein EV421DRAFT_1738014 [Armillaria borealis]|uniref:Uncharacterized protein n=1 Tax=Armillaria borealis TaxID=47425 RepID=A0AA39JBA0_9AGAR|nr:hypothetical protein EV421DRAFT_1738014 [Armillaria borealis]
MPFQNFGSENTVVHMLNSSRKDDLVDVSSTGELPDLGANGNGYDSFPSGLEMVDGLYTPYFDHQEAVFPELLPASYGGQHVETMQDQGRMLGMFSIPIFSRFKVTNVYSSQFSSYNLELPGSSNFFYLPPPLSLSSSVSTVSPSELVQEGYTLNDYRWDARWFSSSVSDVLDVPMDWQNPLIPGMYSMAPPNGEEFVGFSSYKRIVFPVSGQMFRFLGVIHIGIIPPGYRKVQDRTTRKWREKMELSDDFLFYYLRDPPPIFHQCSVGTCPDTFLANDFKDHLKEKHPGITSQPDVTCKGCRKPMKAKSYEDHFLEMHSGRSVRCAYCGDKQNRMRLFVRHFEMCPDVNKYVKRRKSQYDTNADFHVFDFSSYFGTSIAPHIPAFYQPLGCDNNTLFYYSQSGPLRVRQVKCKYTWRGTDEEWEDGSLPKADS